MHRFFIVIKRFFLHISVCSNFDISLLNYFIHLLVYLFCIRVGSGMSLSSIFSLLLPLLLSFLPHLSLQLFQVPLSLQLLLFLLLHERYFHHSISPKRLSGALCQIRHPFEHLLRFRQAQTTYLLLHLTAQVPSFCCLFLVPSFSISSVLRHVFAAIRTATYHIRVHVIVRRWVLIRFAWGIESL